jgi:hypothetical protein
MGGKNMKQAETGIRSPEAPLVPGYLEGDAMDEIKVFLPRTESRGASIHTPEKMFGLR